MNQDKIKWSVYVSGASYGATNQPTKTTQLFLKPRQGYYYY